MCGFLGYIGDVNVSDSDFRALLSRSNHRGPDHAEIHRNKGCLTGFNRLSIQDLSSAGNQPMTSEDSNRILLFNGEIYNHQKLRKSFNINDCEGHGDTETLFRMFDQEGIRSTISLLDGMFAIAWINLTEGRLYLTRDRAGIKPLYYKIGPQGIVFSSQLDQILHFPTNEKIELSPSGVYDYFSLGYMLPPATIFKDINQVEPGQIISIDLQSGKIISRHRYHSFERNISEKNEDVIQNLPALIDQSVSDQLVADVPVSTFMSGGVDSPIINAIAIKHKPDIRAFTFKNNDDESLDESNIANTLSRSIGLKYENVSYESNELMDLVNEQFAGMHEPLGDYSTIPTFLICRALKGKATVVLSGDGGDELFFGYNRHVSFFRHAWLFRFPLAIRRVLSKILEKTRGEKISNSIRSFQNPGAAYRDTQTSIGRADLYNLLGNENYSEACNKIFSVEENNGREVSDIISKADFYGFMQRVLRKVDMMSMIHSVEVRVPYLCNDIIQLSTGYTPEIKTVEDLKAPLKRLFEKCFPGLRPFQRKIGFTVPIEKLMKGPLKEDILELTCNVPVFGEGIINADAFRDYIKKYFEGGHRNHQGVWHLYVWQKWAHLQKLQNK